MGLNSGWAGTPGLRNRFIIFSLAAVAVFLLLILRLWYLQVVSTDRYLSLSEKNRIRYISVAAPRGTIYDRDGKLLVDNRPAFTISVLRQEVDDRQALLSLLSTYLEVPADDLQKRWQGGARFPRYRPVPLADDISRDVLERVQENGIDLPGILAEVRPLRFYPNGEMAAHVFGYLGEITESELGEAREDYRPGDFIGKSGLERRLEKYLRGIAGERRVEVDVLGKELRQLKTQEPMPGNRVFLTLRHDLQQAAEKAFKEESGAAVVIDIHTGEVLALASRPGFDPSTFARGISGQEWIDLLRHPRHPLTNKAVKGQYPPGSTFKIVTALAALRAGVATPNTTVHCSGKFSLGSKDFRCWKRPGHGTVDMKKALKESCDVWFYQVGLELGIDRIAQTARDLGMGEILGLSLEGEKGGLIPDRKWKRERLNERWYDGETVIAAIGQGYVLATPLQLAVMTAAVANGGKVMRPYLIQRIEDLDGKLLLEPQPEEMRTTTFAPAHLRAVRSALDAVVNEPGGTAWGSRLAEAPFAGKTGTSQVVRLRDDHDRKREVPWQFKDHGLFVAYAPAAEPRIAVAVVVEHGGSGSGAAAPIARAILASYFNLPPPGELQTEPIVSPPPGELEAEPKLLPLPGELEAESGD
ncbi:MAG: penicillin-binding protein 2 [Desulfuromonadales bacterium]|nr:penicillin-binding protein 2 [Desulfuromonadales bacterium]